MRRKLFLMVLALVMCSIGTNAQERELQVGKDGFRWYQIYKDGKKGAEDKDGRTLIPTQYSFICYHTMDNNQGYFTVDGQGTPEGVYDRNGNCIISTSRGYTSICKLGDSKKGYYYSVNKGNGEGVCDLNGNCIISTSRGYTNVFKSGDSKEGYYYMVIKGNGWGVCDLNGKEKIFIDNVEIIIPDYIQGKFYYSIKRNGLWGIVQANGQIYITPKYKSLWEEKGKFISDDTGTKRIVGYVSKITTSRNLLAVREEFRSQPSSADFEATPSLASSNSSSSSSSSSVSSVTNDLNRVNENVTIRISRTGIIRIDYGSNTFNFKFQRAVFSERSGYYDGEEGLGGLFALADCNSIKFYGEGGKYIELDEDGVFSVVDVKSLPFYTLSGNSATKNMYKRIKEEMCH